MVGYDPTTFSLSGKCSARLSYKSKNTEDKNSALCDNFSKLNTVCATFVAPINFLKINCQGSLDSSTIKDYLIVQNTQGRGRTSIPFMTEYKRLTVVSLTKIRVPGSIINSDKIFRKKIKDY